MEYLSKGLKFNCESSTLNRFGSGADLRRHISDLGLEHSSKLCTRGMRNNVGLKDREEFSCNFSPCRRGVPNRTLTATRTAWTKEGNGV
jgi:hypothetical protein